MNRFVIMVSALSMAFGISASASAADPSNLPSSDSASRAWLKMNETSYPVTHASVLEQFDRVARTDARLTPTHRARLAAMLQSGQGVEVWVQDDIGFDYLTGRNNGKPWVYPGMRKQLGRLDRALLFDLGDGVSLYWFTGEKGKSCNNIGVVINTPPPIVYNPPPAPKKVKCRFVARPKLTVGQQSFTFLPGFVLQNCCPQCIPNTFIPSLLLSQKTGDEESVSFVQICEPTP